MIKYLVLLIILFIVIYFYISKYKTKEGKCDIEDSDDMSLSDNTKKLLDKSYREHFD